MLLHMLTDAQGRPLLIRVTAANDDERQQVLPMLKHLRQATGKAPRILQADRGYDAEWLRFKASWLLNVRTAIPRRQYDEARKGQYRKPVQSVENDRWKVERAFAWLYRTYKRLTQRCERKPANFRAFTQAALAHFWMRKVLG